MDSQLVEEVVQILEEVRARYSRVPESRRRYSFNIVAAGVRGKRLVLTVTSNTESVSRNAAQDLVVLSYTTNSVPLIVSSRSKGRELEDGVVYRRFGIYTINVETLRTVLVKGENPRYYSEKGGIYVRIRGRVLRELRERYNLSLGEVARKLGLSRKAVYEYERDNIEASPQIARKLVQLFGEEVLEDINLLEWRAEENLLSEVRTELTSSVPEEVREYFPEEEYHAYTLRKCPFEYVLRSKSESVFLKYVGEQEMRKRRDLELEVTTASEVAEILDAKLAIVVEAPDLKQTVQEVITSDHVEVFSRHG